MSTTQTGRQAESAAADYLRKNGFEIVDQNWRTRWCEIDIVAVRQKVVYFVEVKYRKSAVWGDGLDAITANKLRQMQFAADFWVSTKKWNGDYRLLAVSAYGLPPEIDDVVEI